MNKIQEGWKRKNAKYQMEYPVSHERKYHFKGRKQEISHGPDVGSRAYGICENWNKKPYEKRAIIDG